MDEHSGDAARSDTPLISSRLIKYWLPSTRMHNRV